MAQHAGPNLQKPVVGVTGHGRWWSPAWWCTRLSVWLAGGRAVRISTRHAVALDGLHALVIGGGDDIHPGLYNGEVMPKAHYDPERDALERTCIQHALAKGMPMLGICRGKQLINVVCGGTLHSDIRKRRRNTSNRGTVFARKTAVIRSGSRLHQLLGKSRIRINSLHHQAVRMVGDDVRVVARDLDGFVQAVEPSNGTHWLGVQWHPEYLFYRAEHRRLFVWLVGLARQAQLQGQSR